MKNFASSTFNYEQIINAARKVDPVNFMDLAHDHIITGKSFIELKYRYKTVNEIDYTKYQGTTNTCQKCNQIIPIACFRTHNRSGKTYVENVCRKCNSEKDKKRAIKTKNHIMKLVRIQIQENGKISTPALKFNGTGIFTINAALAEKLNISEGDNIDFFQDEAKPKDWYITVSKEFGYPILFSKNKKYTVRKFQKRPLCDLVRKSFGISGTCGTFLIGTPKEFEGNTFYPLLIKKVIK